MSKKLSSLLLTIATTIIVSILLVNLPYWCFLFFQMINPERFVEYGVEERLASVTIFGFVLGGMILTTHGLWELGKTLYKFIHKHNKL